MRKGLLHSSPSKLGYETKNMPIIKRRNKILVHFTRTPIFEFRAHTFRIVSAPPFMLVYQKHEREEGAGETIEPSFLNFEPELSSWVYT